MSLLFSRQCEYALQAVLYLALRRPGERVSIRELTKRLSIPYHFVAKILQALTHKGVVRSAKGPGGGFALALPAEAITLFMVVEAVDGTEFLRTCVLGFPDCSGENPCAVHDAWGATREEIRKMLLKRNVAQMARATKKPEYMS
jgi:Rrf2 family protein